MKNWSYSDILNKSWDSIKSNLLLVATLSLVFIAASFVVSMVPFGGVLYILFYLGYLKCLIKLSQNQEINYSDFFWGFLNINRVLHLILGNLLFILMITIGTILFIIPGVYFYHAYLLWPFEIYEQSTPDAVLSLKTAKKLTEGFWFEIFVTHLIVVGLTLVGVLCFGLGLLITTPISVLILYYAHQQLKLIHSENNLKLSSEIIQTSQT